MWPETVVALYGPEYELPFESTPPPAAVPATCEPWPAQSSGFGSGLGVGWYGKPSVVDGLYESPARSTPPLTLGAAGPKHGVNSGVSQTDRLVGSAVLCAKAFA